MEGQGDFYLIGIPGLPSLVSATSRLELLVGGWKEIAICVVKCIRMQKGSRKQPSKLKRAGEIASVFGKYGFEFLAESQSPLRFLPFPSLLFKRHKPDERPAPERVRLALEELGATYIKLGQAISTRQDMIPDEYVAELAKLQDNAPPVPIEEIEKVIESELGKPAELIFGQFEKTPIGAASIGQVHEAILSDGTQVVVKIQRPGVQKKVQGDLLVLRDAVHFLSEHTAFGKKHDLEDWFEEFAFTLQNELDYTREGRNADRFRENFESDRAVVIPKVYWQYTSARVITYEKIVGLKVDDVAALEKEGMDRHQIACTCALIVLKMIYEHGFFNADPHPGNFFVLPEGRIAIIDPGMVGKLDSSVKDSLTRLTLAVASVEADRLTDELLVFAHTDKHIDRYRLERDVDRLLQTHMEKSPAQLSMAEMLNDMLETAAEYGLHLPSSITMLARALAMSEGMGKQLDPEFNMTLFAKPYLRELYSKRYAPDSLKDRVGLEGAELIDFLLTLPNRARRLGQRFERGEIAVTTKLEGQDRLARHIHLAANRMSMSMISAGLIAAMAILIAAYRPTGFHRWTDILLFLMMGVVVFVGVVLLASMWRARSSDN